jgi:cytoskeleton-associated protein 5
MRIRNPANDMMCEPVQVTKGYVSALLETLADPEGGVREASAEALATLFKFLGEAKVMPFMPDLDNLKLEKIKVSQCN